MILDVIFAIFRKHSGFLFLLARFAWSASDAQHLCAWRKRRKNLLLLFYARSAIMSVAMIKQQERDLWQNRNSLSDTRCVGCVTVSKL